MVPLISHRSPWPSGPLVPNNKVFLLVFLRSESQFQHLRTTSVIEWATIFTGTASLWVLRGSPSNLLHRRGSLTGRGESGLHF
jgi:hypothetical protein